MEEKIKNYFKKVGIELNDIQIKQFKEYYNFLVEQNGKFNLTSITSFEEVITKHFIDSAYPYKMFKENAKIIDIGTGAGFPGVPLKILRPDLNVVLLDSLGKRINFLNELINMLHLKNIIAIHARAEDYAKLNREMFDYSVSRAVARMATLNEYLIPFLKVGGTAVLYKSQDIIDEIDESKKGIKAFGGKIENVIDFSIFNNKRSIILIKKQKNTPKIYPRGKNLPKKEPIIWFFWGKMFIFCY